MPHYPVRMTQPREMMADGLATSNPESENLGSGNISHFQRLELGRSICRCGRAIIPPSPFRRSEDLVIAKGDCQDETRDSSCEFKNSMISWLIRI